MRYLFFICFSIFSLTLKSQSYDLRVEVMDFKELKGIIVVSIYDKTSNFPYKGSIRTLSSEVHKSFEALVISDLSAGEYAVAIHHDVNSDGKCNTNIFGIPEEAYGFSNNCKPIISAPSFQRAKFDLSSDKTITIELIY